MACRSGRSMSRASSASRRARSRPRSRIRSATRPRSWRSAGLPRADRRPRGVSRTLRLGLRARRPVPAGRARLRRRDCARRSRRGKPRPAARARRRRAVALAQPALQRGRRHPPRRDPGCGPEELPAELPGVLREAPFRGRGGRDRRDDPDRRGRGAVRHRSRLRGGGRPRLHARRRDLRGSVDAGAAGGAAGARGATVLANLSGSRSRSAGRGPAACIASRRRRAASRPMSTRPPEPANRRPTSPGTATPSSTRTARCWPRASASRGRRRRRSPTSTSTLLRQERISTGSFDDVAVAEGGAGLRLRQAKPAGEAGGGSTAPRSAPSPSASMRRGRTSASRGPSSASPSCPRIASASPRTATRPTTSRSTGCVSGSRRSARPHITIGVSGGLDSTMP